MASEIFQFPQGYLGFLGSKASGQNPTILGTQVTGVTEMTPFYLAGKALTTATVTVANDTSSPGATTVCSTVPPRKAWVPVFQNTIFEANGAGDVGRYACMVYAPDLGVAFTAGERSAQLNSNFNVTVGYNAIDWFRNLVLIPAGWSFGFVTITNTISASGQSIAHKLSYYEIDV